MSFAAINGIDAARIQGNTEGYRSGHNEAVLKTVWEQSHVGSNPTPSANKKGTFVYQKFLFCLSKPQAWYIITARSAAYIIKGGNPPLYLISPFGAVSLLRLDDMQNFLPEPTIVSYVISVGLFDINSLTPFKNIVSYIRK